MWWFIGGAVVLVVFVGGSVWLLAPTMRTFRGPSFEPAPKDDASVERANQSWTIDGGGGV
jgi:hypothetical protein